MDIPEAIGRLEALPTTSAIADELVSMGIKGYQGIPHNCAIAVYVHETTGLWTGIGAQSIAIGGGEPRYLGITAYVGISPRGINCAAPKVAEFIREFDQGKYPKLFVEVD